MPGATPQTRSRGAQLGADTQPVNTGRWQHGAIGFHGNAKTLLVQGVDQGGVELQQRLATGEHHQAVRVVGVGPMGGDGLRQ